MWRNNLYISLHLSCFVPYYVWFDLPILYFTSASHTQPPVSPIEMVIYIKYQHPQWVLSRQFSKLGNSLIWNSLLLVHNAGWSMTSSYDLQHPSCNFTCKSTPHWCKFHHMHYVEISQVTSNLLKVICSHQE